MGFKAVDPLTLQPSFAELEAQFAYTGDRGLKSPLQLVRLLITEEIVQTVIIPLVNQNLKNRVYTCGKGERSRYRPTDSFEWWRFFGYMLLQRVRKQQKASGLSASEAESADHLIAVHRYTAIKEAHCFDEKSILALTEALRKNLRTKVALGNYGTIDETLKEHFGRAMREAGIDMHMPRKPHPYGLLVYGLAQRLLYSRAPILIDMDPRLPSRKFTPALAFDVLAKRNFSSPCNIYADNAFCATLQASAFRRTFVRVTISFGEGATANLAKLRQACLPDLAKSTCRTFAKSNYTIQITDGDQHPTCVLSTFWYTPNAPPPPVCDLNKYAEAIAIYNSDMSNDYIKERLGIDPIKSSGSRHAFIADHFGVKLHMPPPGPCGLVLTRENLNSISKPLLVILLQETPGATGGSALKKEDIIKEILRHHPAAEPRQTVRDWQAERRSLEQVRAQVLGIPSKSCPVTDKYWEHYGLLDRHDRYLYQVFGTTGFTGWETCLVFTCLFQQVINAHCLNKEQIARVSQAFSGNSAVSHNTPQRLKCASFVGDVIRHLAKEKQEM